MHDRVAHKMSPENSGEALQIALDGSLVRPCKVGLQHDDAGVTGKAHQAGGLRDGLEAAFREPVVLGPLLCHVVPRGKDEDAVVDGFHDGKSPEWNLRVRTPAA